MQQSAEILAAISDDIAKRIAVTVVIQTRIEARHLTRCSQAARRCSEIYVIDSQSTDETVDIAQVRKGSAVSL